MNVGAWSKAFIIFIMVAYVAIGIFAIVGAIRKKG